MRKKVFSAVTLIAVAALLSGCIITNWHDHGRGKAYGHDKSKRGGGGRR